MSTLNSVPSQSAQIIAFPVSILDQNITELADSLGVPFDYMKEKICNGKDKPRIVHKAQIIAFPVPVISKLPTLEQRNKARIALLSETLSCSKEEVDSMLQTIMNS